MTPGDFLTPTTASLPGPANVTAIQSAGRETEASRTNCHAFPYRVHLSNQILHLDFFPPQLLCLCNFSR